MLCKKKMNQWEPIELSQNMVTMYSTQEYIIIASSHGQTSLQLLFLLLNIHTHEDTQLQLAMNLIVSDQALSHE